MLRNADFQGLDGAATLRFRPRSGKSAAIRVALHSFDPRSSLLSLMGRRCRGCCAALIFTDKIVLLRSDFDRAQENLRLFALRSIRLIRVPIIIENGPVEFEEKTNGQKTRLPLLFAHVAVCKRANVPFTF
jgi:hypothetical protein